MLVNYWCLAVKLSVNHGRIMMCNANWFGRMLADWLNLNSCSYSLPRWSSSEERTVWRYCNFCLFIILRHTAPFFRPRKCVSMTEPIAISCVTHLIVFKSNYISQMSCKAWDQQCLPKPYVGVWGRLSAKELWDWLAGWLVSGECVMSCCEERRK